MVKRGIVLLMLGCLCAGGPACAENLWLSADVQQMSVSSDASTLECRHDQCSVWEVTHYTDPQPDGALSLRDLVYYDCAGRRTRTQLEIKLGANGNVLTTVRAREETWLAVQPDTIGGDTLAFACSYQSVDAAELLSGAFDYAGRHFVRLTKIDPAGAVPTSAPTPAIAASRSARMVVQISASPTEIDARNAIAAFERKHQSQLTGLQVGIAQATLNGSKVYRALVEGFATDLDAQAFCTKLKQSGADCFTRPKADSATTGDTRLARFGGPR